MLETIKVLNNVFIIKDSYNNCSNLVIGDRKALLFDTGLGVDDLKTKIKEITNLPLIIINSHGHFDHIGGNTQFEKVFISKDDQCVLKNYNQELLEDWLKAITGKEISLEGKYKSDFNTHVLDFTNFDLGNLECQILKLPGHSKGSIGIFIPKLRIILSGDALLPIITLNFDNHADLDEELKTLEKVNQLDFDFYITGHSQKKYPKSQINRIINCLNNSKTKKHYYYKYPGPPYSPGYFYVDTLEDEPIGVIVAKDPLK